MAKFKRPREREHARLQEMAGRAAFHSLMSQWRSVDPLAAALYSVDLLHRRTTMDDILPRMQASIDALERSSRPL